MFEEEMLQCTTFLLGCGKVWLAPALYHDVLRGRWRIITLETPCQNLILVSAGPPTLLQISTGFWKRYVRYFLSTIAKKSIINLCLLKNLRAQQAPLFGLKSKHSKKIPPFGEKKYRQAHRLLNHLLFQNIPSSAIVRVVPILQQRLGINYNGPLKKVTPCQVGICLDSPSANHRENSGTPRDFISDSENKAADLFPRHVQKQSHRWYLRIYFSPVWLWFRAESRTWENGSLRWIGIVCARSSCWWLCFFKKDDKPLIDLSILWEA